MAARTSLAATTPCSSMPPPRGAREAAERGAGRSRSCSASQAASGSSCRGPRGGPTRSHRPGLGAPAGPV
eukprot:1629254-Alexandrium_andersonii.AAC.1